MKNFQDFLLETLKRNKIETFDFLIHKYNVTEAKKIIEENPKKFHIVVMNIKKLLENLGGMITVNEKYYRSLSEEAARKPGIVLKTELGAVPIDGWHRLNKLHEMGVKDMKFYYIENPKLVKRITIR